jgi:hypothetical protein
MERATEHRVDKRDVANDKGNGVEATMTIEMVQNTGEELMGIFVTSKLERR